MQPEISFASITAPGDDTMRVPLWGVKGVPAGTPVVAAFGQLPDLGKATPGSVDGAWEGLDVVVEDPDEGRDELVDGTDVLLGADGTDVPVGLSGTGPAGVPGGEADVEVGCDDSVEGDAADALLGLPVQKRLQVLARECVAVVVLAAASAVVPGAKVAPV